MGASDAQRESPIQRRYATASGDIAFALLVAEYSAADDDDRLAELIEADGRARLAVGRSVELSRYLVAIPDLRTRSVPLDAAIDIALRGLSGGPRPSPEAVQLLQSRYPELSSGIAEAATLAQAIWSTTGLRRRVEGPKRAVPCDFGPRTPSGQTRYELQKELGAGGWGEVYLAVDRQLSEEGHNALVAIKLLTGPDRGPWARQRLIEEATKARRIDHPHVARVLDRGVTDEGEDYLVYQYVAGGDLARWLESSDRWPSPRAAAALVAKITRGVQAAHAAGIVHCDLKPGNILMNSEGEPLVADFGIAVRAGERIEDILGRADGRPLGNLAFISPEQFRKEPGCFSQTSDVYALGGLLHYLVSKQLPNGGTVEEIARNHDRESGRRAAPSLAGRVSWIDQDLAAICERAMALSPAARYPTAAALADDLEAWLRREELRWHRPSGVRSVALWCLRRPALAVSAALTVCVALSGVGAAAYFAGRSAQVSRQLEDSNRRISLAATMFGGMKSILKKVDEEGLFQDALPTNFLLSWFSEDIMFGSPQEAELTWADRAEILASYLENRRQSGLGESFETLVWETTLGLYMVRAGDFSSAESLLQQNVAAWRRTLRNPGDAWFELIDALRATAAVQRLEAARASAALTPEQAAEMNDIAGRLRPLLDVSAKRLARTSVHLLALDAYRRLCGPDMLGRPDDAAKAQNLLQLAREPRVRESRPR